jgi:GNAT superfamily N-acetyltransferase
MTPIEIRLLTDNDTDAWWKLRLEALERDPEAFSSSVEDHLKLSRDEIRRRLTADPAKNFVLGVFAKGKLLGTAGFVRETQPKSRHKGRIRGVYLNAELRGRGNGRRLVLAVLDRARKIEGVEPRALKIGRHYIDEEYMTLRVR